MAQFIEFAGNNLVLFAALLVIAALIIKTEVGLRLSNIQHLNVNEAVRLMNNEDTVILDVRENREYAEGHIRNAIHIPLSALPKRINELEKYRNKTILAYCRSGNRSSQACRILNKQGFEKVCNMAGGIMGWSSANLPLTQK